MISKRMRELLAHIDTCPLDCSSGKIMKRKDVTEDDILLWFQILNGLKDDINATTLLDIRNRSILTYANITGQDVGIEQ